MPHKTSLLAIPVLKRRPNSTKVSRYLFLLVISLTPYVDQSLKKYFTLQQEVENTHHLRITQWAATITWHNTHECENRTLMHEAEELRGNRSEDVT